jgi:hydrogenase maturation protease
MPTSPDTVVIGAGNPFRRDDGVGPAVVDLLRDRLAGIRFVVCDAAPTAIVDAWTGAGRAVVVTAIRATGGAAGLVHRLDADDPADLGDAVALARVLDRLPGALLIFGVRVLDVGFGHGLSPAVATAARDVADEIAALLADRGP